MPITTSLVASALLALLTSVPVTLARSADMGTISLDQAARDLNATLEVESNNGYTVLETPHRQVIFVPSVRRVTLNGLAFYLNGPYELSRGAGRIAAVDMRTVLRPLLLEEAIPPLIGYPVVVLDPGHGGEDSGAVGLGNVTEKEVVLEIARRVRNALAETGVQVYLTRENDRTLELAERTRLADAHHADMFVSIHLNSSHNRTAEGIETYILPASGFPSTSDGTSGSSTYDGNRFDSENNRIAYFVHKGLVYLTQAEDRGVRRARFEVLRDACCPAVLVECGFVTNVREARRLEQKAYCEQVAQGIVSGVLTYVSRRAAAAPPNPVVLPAEEFAKRAPASLVVLSNAVTAAAVTVEPEPHHTPPESMSTKAAADEPPVVKPEKPSPVDPPLLMPPLSAPETGGTGSTGHAAQDRLPGDIEPQTSVPAGVECLPPSGRSD